MKDINESNILCGPWQLWDKYGLVLVLVYAKKGQKTELDWNQWHEKSFFTFSNAVL